MPGVLIADPGGVASARSAEGELALARGDTALAQQKHAEAGEILERRMKTLSRAREKHYLRFLAATQFYLGGHYQRASELAAKIDPKLLDGRSRELLPPFLKDIRERSSTGYLPRIRVKLAELWKAANWEGVLAALAEHQFVIPPGGQAWLRGVCCLHLGNLTASAHFLAQAYRDPAVKVFALESTAAPIVHWTGQGEAAKAGEYSRLLNASMPNAVVTAASSFVEYSRFTQATGTQRAEASKTQLDLMDQAAEAAGELLAEVGNESPIRWVFALAAAAAADTCRQLRDGRMSHYREFALQADRANTLGLSADFAKWDLDQASQPRTAGTILERARLLATRSTIEQVLPAFGVAA